MGGDITALLASHMLTRFEKKRNVELEFVREEWKWEKGLRLAHSLKDRVPEMRWLASLFPLESLVNGVVPEEVLNGKLREWCAGHPEDARAAAYLGYFLDDDAWIEKAASMGDVWAMSLIVYRYSASDNRLFKFASAAAEKGDARGTFLLVECYQQGHFCDRNESIADKLLEKAAYLGSYEAYIELVRYRPKDLDTMLRLLSLYFFLPVHDFARLQSSLDEALRGYANDGLYGGAIFEVGEMLKGNIDAVEGTVFGHKRDPAQIEYFSQVVAMYEGWCDAARNACVAWILIAKRVGLNKDCRRLIAKIVWGARDEARGNPFKRQRN